ncbi:MAG: lipopolysaccharide biosynthesis protein RfbH [Desulfobacteraceae bacterium]|nr:lipopolysaccharide biosynthesis protein RfbH [Desulfobacteraceae bacterium]
MKKQADKIRPEILALTREYHALAFGDQKFVEGKTHVPCSGRVFDADDMENLVDSALDFWLTSGRFAKRFENDFAQFFGLRHAALVNSGSSANLLALCSLTSPELGRRRLRPGDEVITVAAGFPTTVNPIIQNQLVPVFVDVTVPTYNVDVSQLELALCDRTRAVMLAHTLGNPFDLSTVERFTQRHNLWLIEDCCDAVGALYEDRLVGTFGDLATVSFYPAHHITMGEGGCVLTNHVNLIKLVESFRDWGRHCWCKPGKDNTCGKRFDWQSGSLPYGFDHKYTYSHIGYNLKVTDIQAAIGIAQIKKLPGFIEKRKKNFQLLYENLRDLQEFLILPEPTARSEPSWFGFPIAVRPDAPFTRDELLRHLEQCNIGTRLLFGGNLIHQPAYKDITYRKVGELANSDFVMNQVFWVGVYPGLTRAMIDYLAESLRKCVIGNMQKAVYK